MFMIPDESAQVTLAKRKHKFDSMEALKKEVIKRLEVELVDRFPFKSQFLNDLIIQSDIMLLRFSLLREQLRSKSWKIIFCCTFQQF